MMLQLGVFVEREIQIRIPGLAWLTAPPWVTQAEEVPAQSNIWMSEIIHKIIES
jgi:hypothetical protein